ncbi:hypothetical protein KIH74_24865 [Kineosporia sp. J2-2]|uniref:Uncharacterized protein n=1 Tax=Kineosporia corallincola TaxID=2835133 RepID=A0ABS5TM75_9ACTN|nr:hypothetical protein [Kineosporia corallincola]MBT0772200.1 hypothetical protein [Kineosporia corallincola]
MGALMVSEGRWIKIALVAAVAIMLGTTMMVTAQRARTDAVDLDQTSDQCALPIEERVGGWFCPAD